MKTACSHRTGLILVVFLVLTTLLFGTRKSVAATGIFDFSQALLNKVENKYGKSAVVRLKNLSVLVKEQATGSEMDKVSYTNNFFNAIPYISDWVHWKKKDYWATPFEKVTTYGGDCEDYAIAKYFTLRELGVADHKLRIMYVKAINLGEAHMVLTYFPNADDIPLVLDNITPKILPANKRKDLAPVYSFNAESLWISKSRGTGKKVGGSSRLKLWKNLQERMDDF